MSTTESKRRTITLTDRPPVTIVEADWPEIASATWADSPHRGQANRTGSIRVREHADSRKLVYGVYTTAYQGARDARAGYLLEPSASQDELIRAIHDVAAVVSESGHVPNLAAECIADLPAEAI